MLTAIAATAVPPNCEDLPDDHPLYCGPPPSSTTTTTTTTPTEPPDLSPCPDLIELSGTGTVRFECDWKPENDSSTTGTISVDLVKGDVSRFVLMVRDSSPGDLCELAWDGMPPGYQFEWYEGRLDGDLLLIFPLADDRGSYWDFDYHDNYNELKASTGEHWCGPYDPIAGLRDDLNGDPLHLAVSMRAKKDTTVNVTLFPEQEGTAAP
ncbi:MAG: hypothetical protein ABFS21_06650 [Actinomycetota bacterium]